MNCPICREAMIVLEHEQIEIDHCPSCKGNWLDSGELELLLEDSRAKDHLISTFQSAQDSKEKPRKCPICSKKMEKVLCGKTQEIQIDRCRQDHGFWFDLSELDEMVKAGSFGESTKVLHWLEDIFGKVKQT